MKKNLHRIASLLLVLTCLSSAAQETVHEGDSKMKQYFFVMLSAGNHRNQDSVTVAKIQEGHMANIRQLVNEKKLVVAGPFMDEGNWKGIFIFDVGTKEEVEKLLHTDPAIASGRLAYEIHPWITMQGTCFQ